MSIYGYVRISTKKQSLERQIKNVLDYSEGKALIIQEVVSGTNDKKQEWEKLEKRLKKGDVVIFDSVSRMSRKSKTGFELYKKLFEKDITLIFLKEPHINTDTYKKAIKKDSIELIGSNIDFILEGINKYLLSLIEMQIKIAFDQSEKEVLDLRQRVKEGLGVAKSLGAQIAHKKGQPVNIKRESLLLEIIINYSKDFNGQSSDKVVMEIIKYKIKEHNINEIKKDTRSKKIFASTISRQTYYKYKNKAKEALCLES